MTSHHQANGADAKLGKVEALFKFARTGDHIGLRSAIDAFGLDAHWRDASGATPLIRAAERGRVECTRILAQFGGLDATNRAGLDALAIAAGNGHAPCVSILLGRIETGRRDADGADALMRAALSGSMECVSLLLPKSDPMSRDRRGRSALMLACSIGDAEVAELLAPRSDVEAVDHRGRTAETLARHGGFDGLAARMAAHVLARAEKSAIESAMGKPPRAAPRLPRTL